MRSPACESHVVACLAEELDCRCVRRCSDGRSDTSYVGCHRDRERETDLALVIVRKTAEDRCEQGKHHCGSGSVAHEHGEQGDDDQECQKNGPGFLERFQEKTRKGDIQTIFGSHVGQYESTEEKHDDRIRESRHYALVRYKLTGIRSAEESDSLVGDYQKRENYDEKGGSPVRDYLEHPHQGGEDE